MNDSDKKKIIKEYLTEYVPDGGDYINDVISGFSDISDDDDLMKHLNLNLVPKGGNDIEKAIYKNLLGHFNEAKNILKYSYLNIDNAKKLKKSIEINRIIYKIDKIRTSESDELLNKYISGDGNDVSELEGYIKKKASEKNSSQKSSTSTNTKYLEYSKDMKEIDKAIKIVKDIKFDSPYPPLKLLKSKLDPVIDKYKLNKESIYFHKLTFNLSNESDENKLDNYIDTELLIYKSLIFMVKTNSDAELLSNFLNIPFIANKEYSGEYIQEMEKKLEMDGGANTMKLNFEFIQRDTLQQGNDSIQTSNGYISDTDTCGYHVAKNLWNFYTNNASDVNDAEYFKRFMLVQSNNKPIDNINDIHKIFEDVSKSSGGEELLREFNKFIIKSPIILYPNCGTYDEQRKRINSPEFDFEINEDILKNFKEGNEGLLLMYALVGTSDSYKDGHYISIVIERKDNNYKVNIFDSFNKSDTLEKVKTCIPLLFDSLDNKDKIDYKDNEEIIDLLNLIDNLESKNVDIDTQSNTPKGTSSPPGIGINSPYNLNKPGLSTNIMNLRRKGTKGKEGKEKEEERTDEELSGKLTLYVQNNVDTCIQETIKQLSFFKNRRVIIRDKDDKTKNKSDDKSDNKSDDKSDGKSDNKSDGKSDNNNISDNKPVFFNQSSQNLLQPPTFSETGSNQTTFRTDAYDPNLYNENLDYDIKDDSIKFKQGQEISEDKDKDILKSSLKNSLKYTDENIDYSELQLTDHIDLDDKHLEKILRKLLRKTINKIVEQDIMKELSDENKELKSKLNNSYTLKKTNDLDNSENKSLDDIPKLRGKNYFF